MQLDQNKDPANQTQLALVWCENAVYLLDMPRVRANQMRQQQQEEAQRQSEEAAMNW